MILQLNFYPGSNPCHNNIIKRSSNLHVALMLYNYYIYYVELAHFDVHTTEKLMMT